MRPMRIVSCLLLVAAGGCARAAAPAAGDRSAPQPARTAVRRNPNVITRDQLADPSLSRSSALEAVRLLRPTFLVYRGAISVNDPGAGSVRVSIDGSSVSSLDDLAAIRASDVRSIRYLSASDATQRFGIASGGSPVIVVERM